MISSMEPGNFQIILDSLCPDLTISTFKMASRRGRRQAPRTQIQGREGNDQNQSIAGKAGGGNSAQIGEGVMDFLVQPAVGDLLVGKAGPCVTLSR